MATMTMTKDSSEKALPTNNQGRLTEKRFRLQVDRQTKESFSDLADAQKAGNSIKAAHPIVKVTIYDAEKSEVITLDG